MKQRRSRGGGGGEEGLVGVLRRLWRKRRGSAVEAEGERRRAGEEADAHAAARHMAMAAVSGEKNPL